METLHHMFGAITQWRSWYLLGLRDIQLRYMRSVIGPFWISISLAVMILTLAYLYSHIFKQEYETFLTFLACGLLVFNFIQMAIVEGCNSVSEHSTFIRNVRMPLSALVARVVFRNVLLVLHNAIAVGAILLVFGHRFEPTAMLAIPGFALVVLFVYGCGLALGPISTRFRDIPQIVTSAMQMMFFLTPVIWMPDMASGRPLFLDGNPFFHLLEITRTPLLGGIPSQESWIVAGGLTVGAFILGFLSIAASHRRVALWL